MDCPVALEGDQPPKVGDDYFAFHKLISNPLTKRGQPNISQVHFDLLTDKTAYHSAFRKLTLAQPERIYLLSHILPVRAPCSEGRCLPNRALVTGAAKVPEEPKLTDAAQCMNGGYCVGFRPTMRA